MPRFFTDSSGICDGRITLTGPDVNHIKNVLRMNEGDSLTISDGQGADYSCEIETLGSSEIVAVIRDMQAAYSELPVQITLFQGLPKGDKMELIIQKAVELGVYAIVPVVMKRTIVKLDEKKADKRIARWQAIAESAAKQAGRAMIPQVSSVISMKEALGRIRDLDVMLVPYEKAEGMDAARDLVRSLRGAARIGILIGPEGGFEASEIEAALAEGARVMTLGHRILRTETAGMTVLSILMFELEQD